MTWLVWPLSNQLGLNCNEPCIGNDMTNSHLTTNVSERFNLINAQTTLSQINQAGLSLQLLNYIFVYMFPIKFNYKGVLFMR